MFRLECRRLGSLADRLLRGRLTLRTRMMMSEHDSHATVRDDEEEVLWCTANRRRWTLGMMREIPTRAF